jgi:hypothetical protein
MSLFVSNVAKLSLNVSFPFFGGCCVAKLSLFVAVVSLFVAFWFLWRCWMSRFVAFSCLCVSLSLCVTTSLFLILFVCVRCRCMSLHVSFWVVCFAGRLKLSLIMWCCVFADVSVCPWMFVVACWVLLSVSICSVWLVCVCRCLCLTLSVCFWIGCFAGCLYLYLVRVLCFCRCLYLSLLFVFYKDYICVYVSLCLSMSLVLRVDHIVTQSM